nr:hypothetical protein [Rhizobium etli]
METGRVTLMGTTKSKAITSSPWLDYVDVNAVTALDAS